MPEFRLILLAMECLQLSPFKTEDNIRRSPLAVPYPEIRDLFISFSDICISTRNSRNVWQNLENQKYT